MQDRAHDAMQIDSMALVTEFVNSLHRDNRIECPESIRPVATFEIRRHEPSASSHPKPSRRKILHRWRRLEESVADVWQIPKNGLCEEARTRSELEHR